MNISYYRKVACVSAGVLLWLFAAAAFRTFAEDIKDLNVVVFEREYQIKKEVETKIKNEILDPMLGRDRASVFADIELDIIANKHDESGSKLGVSQKYKEAPGNKNKADTDFILPGVPKPKSVRDATNERPSAAQALQAQQEKGLQKIRYGVETEFKRFQVTILHDESLPKESLEAVRQKVNDILLPYKIRQKDPATILFKPARFKSIDWRDDLKRPNVYLPLLYAFLALFLLLFLFGPLAGFMRRYVKAILAKPGAEVNIENKEEEGKGGGGDGEGEGVKEGHQQIEMMFQQKSAEEEDSEEEDEMKKFAPFAYINEENLKRLVYMFLLRKEEPWLIAVVLSYLKPEYARQALSIMPVELQAKVAMEAITVRQVTREQGQAIDSEIKENIDFVVGGVEGLVRMIDDADPVSRQNILEYLKAQKPILYDKVKKSILTFEDIANFPDRSVQQILRGLNSETMEYSLEITPVQIDDARIKILDDIKALEKEGKIVVREKVSDEASTDDIDMSAARSRMQKISGAEQSPAPSGGD